MRWDITARAVAEAAEKAAKEKSTYAPLLDSVRSAVGLEFLLLWEANRLPSDPLIWARRRGGELAEQLLVPMTELEKQHAAQALIRIVYKEYAEIDDARGKLIFEYLNSNGRGFSEAAKDLGVAKQDVLKWWVVFIRKLSVRIRNRALEDATILRVFSSVLEDSEAWLPLLMLLVGRASGPESDMD